MLGKLKQVNNMLTILLVLAGLASYLFGVFIGIYVEKRQYKNTVLKLGFKGYSRFMDNLVATFDENTFFVEPKDVVESYKQSSNVTEFINKIK
jgi:hypothetical protein